jgi:membrane-anchored protein YejM (alkaline phosphatase superfamily)
MTTDGPRKLKVSMGYFWNMFLPILAFIVFGAILLMILQWPDDTLQVMSKNVKSALNLSALDPK